MIGRAVILSLCLGAFAASPVTAADSPEDVHEVANGLRDLLQAASRTGLVDLKGQSAQDEPAEDAPTLEIPVADCLAIAPLFDGGQDRFATGEFTELTRDWPETAALAGTLDVLLDPAYDGTPLPVDLRRSGECGSSFLPWQVLADPSRPLDAKTEASLTTALSHMKPSLRRMVGVQIAIRAGLENNIRLSRRVADTLTDAGLHGRAHHQRDMDHVLLDALLKMTRDPVGARARLSWIAERDGPEQFHAIDLLRNLDANGAARHELERLSDSADEAQRESAQIRLIATAIEDADIELVAEMVAATDMLGNDAASLASLNARLDQAVSDGDALKAVQALDVIERLRAKGVEFDAALLSKAARRLKALSHNPDEADASASYSSELSVRNRPKTVSAAALDDYLGSLSSDLATFEEVLNRG